MIKTHKIKIYPNAHMRVVLNELFDYRRFVWNAGLETWNDMYDSSLAMGDKKLRPNWRKVRDELTANKQDWQYQLSSRVLQQSLSDLGQAWDNFFNKNMPNHSKPKFKSKKRSRKSFKTDRVRIIKGKLMLDKPLELVDDDWVGIRMSEQPRFEGELRLTNIVKDADGYYASLSIAVDETVAPSTSNKITAVDVNIGRFTYKLDGEYAEQATLPNQLTYYYDKITLYQRKLARKRVENPNRFNSNSYRATRAKLNRSYQKVERIQKDLLDKFTTQLVNQNDVIGIEDLDVNHMKMNKHLAKNLHRSMFGKFKTIMQYKAEWQAKTLVLVDQTFPSTQRCSECGYIKSGDDKITLQGNKKHHTKHNEYICYQCGAIMNRDENAVENLIQYALNSVWGQAMPQFKELSLSQK